MADIRFAEGTLYLSGILTFKEVPSLQKKYVQILRSQKITRLDPSGIEHIDNAGVAFWETIICQVSDQGSLTILPARPEVQKVMDTFSSIHILQTGTLRHPGFFETIGTAVISWFQAVGKGLLLASEIFYFAFVGIFNRKAQRRGSLTQQCIVLGQNAVPIIVLLSFIIGYIISLQAAVPLRNYGAGTYLADLLAYAMVRELGPLMTAIIVAGRSGSAIASEVASMQVSEEIDALRMMGLNPVRYIIIPKFHALTLVMPILVTFSIIMGEIGGSIVAISYLDVNIASFFERTINVLTSKDLIITLAKSLCFAWIIVVIGAHNGFRVKGGAEGVGKATTSSVVNSIFSVILIDALFGLLYL